MKTNNLEKNINRYMDLKKIRFYSDLLHQIGKKLGKNPYEFAEKEKSNFSKMLKGVRPLKYEYIIPLEEIFGVPLAKLLNEDIYFESINKEDIPFIKSFRYYAYKDEYELYKELDKSPTGENTLYPYETSDEYCKCFIDYLVEYKSINGFKFLVKEHKFQLHPNNPKLYRIDNKTIIPTSMINNTISKTIMSFDDADLYKKIYGNPNESLIWRYIDLGDLYDDSFFESILNTKNIFKTLFEEGDYNFDTFNKGVFPKSGIKPKIHLINPLINLCLNCALNHLDKYKDKAVEILKTGIKFNNKSRTKIKEEELDFTYKDELGYIYYKQEIITNMVIIDEKIKIKDKEINTLINKLTK